MGNLFSDEDNTAEIEEYKVEKPRKRSKNKTAKSKITVDKYDDDDNIFSNISFKNTHYNNDFDDDLSMDEEVIDKEPKSVIQKKKRKYLSRKNKISFADR